MAFAALVPLSGESSHDLSDRLVSLLREWDDDGSCTATRRDVQMALTALGLRVDLESLDGLFEAMSSDGRLRYDALGRLLKQGAARVDHYRDLDKLERLKLVMHDVDARLKAVRADVAAMAAAAAIDSELTERSRRLVSTAAAQTARQLGAKRPPLAHARTSPTACTPPSRAPAAAALAHACSLPSLVRSPGEAGPSAGGSPPAPRSGSPPPRRGRGRSYRKADMIRLSELRLPQVPRGWAAIRAVPSPSTQRALNRKSSAMPRAFKVDMHSALSVEAQVRDALVANGSRVMELFRSWDDDGDGEVSKAEFQRAMLLIGLCAPPEATGAQKSAVTEAVSSLFDSFDSDGGGTIGFRELNKMLRRTVAPAAPHPPAPRSPPALALAPGPSARVRNRLPATASPLPPLRPSPRSRAPNPPRRVSTFASPHPRPHHPTPLSGGAIQGEANGEADDPGRERARGEEGVAHQLAQRARQPPVPWGHRRPERARPRAPVCPLVPTARAPPPLPERAGPSHPPHASPRSRRSAQIALLESIQPSEADLRRRKNSRDGIVADPLMFGIPSA